MITTTELAQVLFVTPPAALRRAVTLPDPLGRGRAAVRVRR
ncbi:hypothetical protein [Nonomuraea salmonea]